MQVTRPYRRRYSAHERREAPASPIAGYEFLICGLVRNCGRHIDQSIARLSNAIEGAKRIRWLIIESDSEDNTVASLNTLSQKLPDFEFVSLGQLRSKMPRRTDRIAFCRNHYLSEISRNEIYKRVDYVVVADLDGVNEKITRDAFESCWDRGDWDACMANQDGPYYDIWALRHPLWSPVDCWEQLKFLSKYERDSEVALSCSVYSKMITIPRDAEWIQVDSAFGGLAIYKKNMLSLGKYRGLTNDGEETCEHVPFHLNLRHHGARLFINPRLINATFTEHSRRLQFWMTVRRCTLRLFRRLHALFSSGYSVIRSIRVCGAR